MRIFLTTIILLFTIISCSPEGEMHAKLTRSFKTYIKNNDEKKELITDLKEVEVISYSEISNQENDKEKYEARIFMRGTTSYSKGSRIYNLNDTVSCYFDESLTMLRLEHETEE